MDKVTKNRSLLQTAVGRPLSLVNHLLCHNSQLTATLTGDLVVMSAVDSGQREAVSAATNTQCVYTFMHVYISDTHVRYCRFSVCYCYAVSILYTIVIQCVCI